MNFIFIFLYLSRSVHCAQKNYAHIQIVIRQDVITYISNLLISTAEIVRQNNGQHLNKYTRLLSVCATLPLNNRQRGYQRQIYAF